MGGSGHGWIRSSALAVLAGLLVLGVVAFVAEDQDGPVKDEDAARLSPGPLRDRLAWTLAYVNAGAGEVEDGFAPSFLARVPLDQLAQVVEQRTRPGGPFVIEEVAEASATRAVLLVRGATGVAVTMRISIEPSPPHRITGLTFEAAPEARVVPVAAPAGPIGEQLRWVLGALNEPAPPDNAVIEDRLSRPFLDQVPPERFRELLEGQLRPQGPFALERWTGPITTTSLSVVLRGATGAGVGMQLTIDAAPPHRIAGLHFQPAPAERPPTSWAELERRLVAAAPEVAFLAAEVVGGQCRDVYGIGQDRVLALGSAFKLYVLGALARAVEQGRMAWEEQVPLRDGLRVHSSPTYGTAASGTSASLQDLATAMIAVSDNTATDHVMDRLGRGSIEEEQGRLGMADADRNRPFLTTREVTLLKWGRQPELREAYIGAGRTGRSQVLKRLADAGLNGDELPLSPTPVAVDTIEWFASPADLCRVHVALQQLARKAALSPVRDILSKNPGAGVAIDRRRWPYIAFKGGSEPGVLALSWLGERSDGRTFVIAALLRDKEKPLSHLAALEVAAAFRLL